MIPKSGSRFSEKIMLKRKKLESVRVLGEGHELITVRANGDVAAVRESSIGSSRHWLPRSN